MESYIGKAVHLKMQLPLGSIPVVTNIMSPVGLSLNEAHIVVFFQPNLANLQAKVLHFIKHAYLLIHTDYCHHSEIELQTII